MHLQKSYSLAIWKQGSSWAPRWWNLLIFYVFLMLSMQVVLGGSVWRHNLVCSIRDFCTHKQAIKWFIYMYICIAPNFILRSGKTRDGGPSVQETPSLVPTCISKTSPLHPIVSNPTYGSRWVTLDPFQKPRRLIWVPPSRTQPYRQWPKVGFCCVPAKN